MITPYSLAVEIRTNGDIQHRGVAFIDNPNTPTSYSTIVTATKSSSWFRELAVSKKNFIQATASEGSPCPECGSPFIDGTRECQLPTRTDAIHIRW